MKKWLVSETFVYEVEAEDYGKAIDKVSGQNPAERVRIDHQFSAESWWNNERKDELQEKILEALESSLGKWPAHTEKTENWWEKAEKKFGASGWLSGDIREKHLVDDEGDFCMHPTPENEDSVCVGLIYENERVYWVEMGKEDALKILTLGPPF